LPEGARANGEPLPREPLSERLKGLFNR
jgi:hypothetical protein